MGSIPLHLKRELRPRQRCRATNLVRVIWAQRKGPDNFVLKSFWYRPLAGFQLAQVWCADLQPLRKVAEKQVAILPLSAEELSEGRHITAPC